MYRRIARSHTFHVGLDEPVADRVGHPNGYRHEAEYDKGLLFLKYNEKDRRNDSGDDPERAIGYMNKNIIADRICNGMV